MTIRRGFFNVVTDDLAASRAFYVDLLGFRPAFESAWFVNLAAPSPGGVELGLLKRDSDVVPQGAQQTPWGGMLTLVVDDVDALHARARAAGVEVIEAPRNLFYGQRRMLLRDPNGMLLDLSSECAPDPDWMARVRQRDDGAYVED